MVSSLRRLLFPPGIPALHALWILFVWGTLHRLQLLLQEQDLSLRHGVHFAIGSGYEMMLASLVAILVYAAALLHRRSGQVLAFTTVTALLFYGHVNQAYVLIFGTHLPYSTTEYLGEARHFTASIREVLLSVGFVGMVLVPVGIAAWLMLRPAQGRARAAAKASAPGWKHHGVTLSAYLLVGLLANTASNSYVAKNPHNPLQYTPLQYLLYTRKATVPRVAELDDGVRERWGREEPFYPFWRRQRFAGCADPPSAFRRLCASLSRMEQPPNVVLIMLESFRAAEIGRYGARESDTPEFDRLAGQGILFREFYANSFQTRHAISAAYCSLYPNDGLSLLRAYSDVRLRCLPEVLRSLGYSTLWVHNGDAEFDGMRAFFRRNGVERVVDRWDFPAGSERLGWGLSDKVLMEQTVAEMARLREPFMTGLLSMTNHHPFEVPAEFQRRQDQGLYGRFRDSMAYTDFTLGHFIRLARKHGFFKRTLFFVFADTAIDLEVPGVRGESAASIKAKYQIPLLLLPGMAEQGQVVTAVGSQVDLPPLIMDLLGYEGMLPWAGRSFFTEPSGAFALFHKPGQLRVLATADGLFMQRPPHSWRGVDTPAAPPVTLISRTEDLLLLTRWALQNNRVVPAPE